MAEVGEWLEGQAARAFDRQRAQVDTAKLLVTFSTGVAATLVAAAIQVNETSRMEKVSIWLLACAAIMTVGVVLLDRMREANHHDALVASAINGWTDDELINELRTRTLQAVDFNEQRVKWVRAAAYAQYTVATTSGVLATLALQAR